MKPCPFCGGHAVYEEWTDCIGHGDYIKVVAVVCKECHATGPQIDNYDHPKKDLEKLAIEGWEARNTNGTEE